MAFELNKLVRPNVLRLKPYSSARNEFSGEADVFLDANENAFGSPAGNGYNRYPDPEQKELKRSISKMKGLSEAQMFIGNGSDEAIDLLIRLFCEPRIDEILICPPTYGMYRVSAGVNDVSVAEVPLTANFDLDVTRIMAATTDRTKLIFVCSPNNPTGNLMSRDSVIELLEQFGGIVAVDEAYIDFSSEPSLIKELDRYPNLVVTQTFSKAWGMAGLRVGMAFASEGIVALLDRIKPPYNVSSIAQNAVDQALCDAARVATWTNGILRQREELRCALTGIESVLEIFPSEANFLLVRVTDAELIYRHLVADGIVVRNRNNVELCAGCLRITVGTADENARLIGSIGRYEITSKTSPGTAAEQI